MGWAVGAGGEPKAGSSIHLTGKSSHCVSTEVHTSLVRPIRSPAAV